MVQKIIVVVIIAVVLYVGFMMYKKYVIDVPSVRVQQRNAEEEKRMGLGGFLRNLLNKRKARKTLAEFTAAYEAGAREGDNMKTEQEISDWYDDLEDEEVEDFVVLG